MAAELTAAALEGLVPDAVIDASSPLTRRVPPFLQARSHRRSDIAPQFRTATSPDSYWTCGAATIFPAGPPRS